MVTNTTYEVAIVDNAGVLREIIEVDKSEWVTSIGDRKVQLQPGHDLRERIGNFCYNQEKQSWFKRRDPNPPTETLNWENIRLDALSNAVPPPEWPKGVRPISLHGTALIGLDEDLNLYWDGRPVEIKKKLSLNRWQNILANITAFSAFTVAGVELVSFIINILR